MIKRDLKEYFTRQLYRNSLNELVEFLVSEDEEKSIQDGTIQDKDKNDLIQRLKVKSLVKEKRDIYNSTRGDSNYGFHEIVALVPETEELKKIYHSLIEDNKQKQIIESVKLQIKVNELIFEYVIGMCVDNDRDDLLYIIGKEVKKSMLTIDEIYAKETKLDE